ncbi:MAG: glycosyltransferase family 2 protein [bacterium]|nr:glycosyltransferase family 2 protein [bacterium]
MRDPVAKYLAKLALAERWPLSVGSTDGLRQAVVIPVLDEQDYLSATLDSLARNPRDELDRTLVVCVVNNRADSDHEEAARRNQETLADLERRMAGGSEPGANLRLAVVDASSPGCELPPRQGVGLARKIGMDWACRILHDIACPRGLIFSLDADTAVEPDYLSAARDGLECLGASAGVVDFAHPLDGPEDLVRAIVCYELFLRHYVIGLRIARSPYAFHSVGSTMVCTVGAYAAVSGMNRRQGGEDFYFLQKLAKTCGVAHIPGTTVYPSPRPSPRVPFGTGPRVRRFLDGTHDEYRGYHPESFRVVGDWLGCLEAACNAAASDMLGAAGRIHPVLPDFLSQEGLPAIWDRLRRNAADAAAFRDQLHRWFDGLKTLKLFHVLRDESYPDQGLFEVIDWLLQAGKAPIRDEFDPATLTGDLAAQIRLLEALRSWEKG